MMDATKALAERVNAHYAAVESSARVWAARTRKAAEECGAPEGALLADAVEAALLADGAYGLVDLVLAGPSIGGLDDEDIATLVRLVDERLAGHALAA